MIAAPPPWPRPAPGQVDIWLADLDSVAVDDAVMDAVERQRAAALRTAELRRRFAASRTLLRGVLAGYCDRPAAEIGFRLEAHGRPVLAPPCAGLGFSLSHSGSAFALAVAGAPVGVDVERSEDIPEADLTALAARILSPDEQSRFDALGEADRPAAMYALWTAKEALLKAMGVGLARDPRTVSLGWAERLRVQEGPGVYDVARFEIDARTPGAVALAGELKRVRLRRWREPTAEMAAPHRTRAD